MVFVCLSLFVQYLYAPHSQKLPPIWTEIMYQRSVPPAASPPSASTTDTELVLSFLNAASARHAAKQAAIATATSVQLPVVDVWKSPLQPGQSILTDYFAQLDDSKLAGVREWLGNKQNKSYTAYFHVLTDPLRFQVEEKGETIRVGRSSLLQLPNRIPEWPEPHESSKEQELSDFGK